MEAHINGINDRISRKLNELLPTARLQAYGLAESVSQYDEGNEATFAAIVFPEGECKSVFGETDKHDVTLYHRLNDISFQENSSASIGSTTGYTEVDDMSIIVFGKRKCISPIRMERIARAAIAAINTNTIVRSDFNALQVFANEYIGAVYFLTPEYFLFKINYRITGTYNVRCAKIE